MDSWTGQTLHISYTELSWDEEEYLNKLVIHSDAGMMLGDAGCVGWSLSMVCGGGRQSREGVTWVLIIDINSLILFTSSAQLSYDWWGWHHKQPLISAPTHQILPWNHIRTSRQQYLQTKINIRLMTVSWCKKQIRILFSLWIDSLD